MPHALLGTAFSDALAIYLLNPGEDGYNRALEAARATLEGGFDDSSEWSLEGIFELLKKGMAEAASTSLKEMLKNEEVLDCELTIGRARLDLTTQDKATGELIVTDHKSKIKLDPKYVNSFLDETLHDWQLKDYSVRAAKHYGRSVLYRRRHLIVLTPKCKTYVRTEKNTFLDLRQWHASAEIHWRRMAQDEKYPLNAQPMNEHYCIHPKYKTKCRAYDACHVYFRDETKMEALYERKKRRGTN